MEKNTRDPLGPIDFMVTTIGSLLILGTVASIPLTVLGSGSFLGFGHSVVCAVRAGISWDIDDSANYLGRLAPQASASPDGIQVCQAAAPMSANLLESAQQAMPFLFFCGFLFLTWRVVRAARKRGLFADVVARRISGMGWYLLLGSLAAAALECLFRWRLLAHLMPEETPHWSICFTLPWAPVIAGFCVLSLGRVMAHAVRMQREVDTLV